MTRSCPKRPCFCGDSDGSCLFQDNGLILCFHGLEYRDSPPPGYKFVKEAKDGMGGVFAPESTPSSQPQSHNPKDYIYQNADGVPHQQVKRRYRNGKKQFAQSHWDGLGWKSGLPKGFKRIPYRLPEVVKSQRVAIVEGEKDCETARTSGLEAKSGIKFTTNPQGAGKWPQGWGQEHFRDKDVIIFPDNDLPGLNHARQVYQDLQPAARSLAIAQLPNLPEKGDLTDFLESGRSVKDICELVEQAIAQPESFGLEQLPTKTQEEKEKTENPQRKSQSTVKGKSQSTVLVELSLSAGIRLLHTPEGEGFADLDMNGYRATYKLRGKDFKGWLNRQFYLQQGKTAGSLPIQEALGVLDGKAQFEGPEMPVFTRLAEGDGRIYLDLGRSDWSAIAIGPEGWQLISEPPVRFRRPKGMLPLPIPERGGKVADLKEVLNIKEEDWPLIAVWLLFAFKPNHSHPILMLSGEQGSGKSSTARLIKSLVDPSKAELQPEPRDVGNLMVSANNRWILAFDNLSRVSNDLSDSLCRLSTGGGFSTRQLYTDDEETIFEATRPVILTGIEELATRGDLLDRLILVSLPNIPDNKRLAEAEILPKLEKLRPGILGALLDAVSATLKRLPEIKPQGLPRMADFARWGIAGEAALGLEPGSFLRAYQGNREAAHGLAIEASPAALAIQKLMEHRTVWKGTATELLRELIDQVEDQVRKSRAWPATPKGLSSALQRLAPNLRTIGIDIRSERTNKNRYISLERLRKNASPSSLASLALPGLDFGSDAKNHDTSLPANNASPVSRKTDTGENQCVTSNAMRHRCVTTSKVSNPDQERVLKVGDASDDGDAKKHTQSKSLSGIANGHIDVSDSTQQPKGEIDSYYDYLTIGQPEKTTLTESEVKAAILISPSKQEVLPMKEGFPESYQAVIADLQAELLGCETLPELKQLKSLYPDHLIKTAFNRLPEGQKNLIKDMSQRNPA